jgi:branched-chain amino acid transport system permease protein
VTPGITREDGDLRIRVMKGMELSPVGFVLLLAGIGLLFALPDIAFAQDGDPIQLSLIQNGLLFGMAAIGLNLLLRHTGLVSFGHAAFFGTGAYTVAVFVTKFGITDVLFVLAGAVAVTIIVSALIGAFAVRYTGLYFALLTLAFGQVLFSLTKGLDYFNGTDGLILSSGDLDGVELGFGLTSTGGEVASVFMYYMSAVFLLIGLFVMYRIVKSPFGNALDAIGQNRTRARFIGIPVRVYTFVAFVISGIYGGIAGGMFAMTRNTVRPAETLQVFVSGDILYMAILGGFDTLLGPLIGGFVLENLLVLADQIELAGPAATIPAGGLITGIVLIIIVLALPEGIVGSLQPGGRVYEGASNLAEDPGATVSDWGRRVASGLGGALSRAGTNIRVLLLGVK